MEYEVLAPAVFLYPFPENLAKDLVASLNEDIEWSKSAIGINRDTQQEHRTSNSYPFESDMPMSADRVKRIMVDCVNDYMRYHGINVTQDEGLDLLRYEIGEKYDYHTDANWTMYRTVSMLIYLNPTEYDGGETHFKYFDLNVKPDYPSIVIFPSNYAYEHTAKPVTNGVKYVLVTWGNDLPNGFSARILLNIAGSVGVH